MVAVLFTLGVVIFGMTYLGSTGARSPNTAASVSPQQNGNPSLPVAAPQTSSLPGGTGKTEGSGQLGSPQPSSNQTAATPNQTHTGAPATVPTSSSGSTAPTSGM